METLFKRVAGLDLHQKTVVACVRITGPDGQPVEEIKTFGTMTGELLDLSDWLVERRVAKIAMESTGVLWKPVWNILDGRSDWELMLVNPRELKHVAGRKSDVMDSQWIAHLLACGLLRPSFVPERQQRDLRDLTRMRAALTDEHTRTVNRLHKVLQDGNIKLTSVATNILGVSGREMLTRLMHGEQDVEVLAELARGRLRKKIPQLKQALRGELTKHHQFLLEQIFNHLTHLEVQLAEFEVRIAEELRPFATPELIQRLDEIPGINQKTIDVIVAELGVDMSHYPTAGHVSSWAGLCPGNEESAGKRKKSRTTKGNVWLRRALGEAAWAAAHAKDSYFAAQYRRLSARRGKKRALVAVAHSLLEVIYHLLKDPTRKYQDKGVHYFDTLEPDRLRRQLVKRLEGLGFDVTLNQRAAA
jgi:transposase